MTGVTGRPRFWASLPCVSFSLKSFKAPSISGLVESRLFVDHFQEPSTVFEPDPLRQAIAFFHPHRFIHNDGPFREFSGFIAVDRLAVGVIVMNAATRREERTIGAENNGLHKLPRTILFREWHVCYLLCTKRGIRGNDGADQRKGVDGKPQCFHTLYPRLRMLNSWT